MEDKNITWWQFDGKSLQVLPVNTTYNNVKRDPLKLTTYMIEELRDAKEKAARNWMEDTGRVIRLLEPKRIRDNNGNQAQAMIKIEKGTQRNAVAAQMFLLSDNRRRCKNCKNVQNHGPFATCCAFGPDTFGRACSCCQYSGAAAKCEFHFSQRGYAFSKTEDAEDAAEHSWPTITAEMLEKASTRELELTRTWINKELDDRLGLSSAPPSANKRRRLQ
ncbi:hypothetical protein MGN70_005450 [Eutypa lata]|nr:hypothetical protein MGN70_007407 [Eutypa lata]KAI1253242.1 hypothetical protein MGN70_005450 [Eutypa lata]